MEEERKQHVVRCGGVEGSLQGVARVIWTIERVARDRVEEEGRGVPSTGIAFVGESAGGGLVAATLAALKDAALPQPSCAPVFSPWADLTVSGASAVGKADLDPALTPEALRTRARDYLGDRDPATPLASPIFADLTGLPPLLIQVGSHEILLDDAIRLAARAAQHDVPVELQVWPEVLHVFQGFAAILDDADRALNAAAAFVKRNWAD